MTVESVVSKIIYAGDGVTTIFPYPFKIFKDEDLIVTEVIIATGVRTVKALTTHYTVAGAGNATGGDATMLVAPAATVEIAIQRGLDLKQELDLVENDPSPSQTREDALDKIVMMIQQNAEKINRAFLRDVTQTGEIITDIDATWYYLRAIDLGDSVVTRDLDWAGYLIKNITGIWDADEDTGVQVEESADEDKIRFDIGGTQRMLLDNLGLKLFTGADVLEFSIDGTLAGNSDDAVPTEKAVKTYIDTKGKVAATKVVAASDSIADRADYICDGNNDQVEIQQAIDAVAAGGVGGRVILLEGTYIIAATVTINAGDEDLILQGQGWGTVLEIVANRVTPTISITCDRITIRNLYVDAGTNAQAVEQNYISAVAADYLTIEGIKVYGGQVAVVDGTGLINLNDCDYFKVLNNTLIITAEGAAERGLLMLMGGSQLGIVKGNIIDGSASAVNTSLGISGYGSVSGYTRCVISDNVIIGDGADFDYGIYLGNHADFSDNVITCNQIYNCGTDSIIIVGANAANNLVDGNMARDGIADTGTATVVGDNVVA